MSTFPHHNDKLTLGESDIGVGIFANDVVRAGTVLAYLSGRIALFEDLVQQPLEGENAIQIGPGLYVEPGFPMRFINHSCSPNAGINKDLALIAIEHIPEGDEVRIDYSTTMYERFFTMPCECKAENCRGLIRDFDLLPKNLQNHYTKLGVVQSFILKETATDPPNAPTLLDAIREECRHSVGRLRVPSEPGTHPIRVEPESVGVDA